MKKLFRNHKIFRVLAIVAAIALVILPISGVLSATTADVTVTATGKYVAIADNTTTYDFGAVAASSTTNTSLSLVLITNTSSVSTNATVSVTTNEWTSVGDNWTHSDTAAGANTAAMKAQSSNVSATWGTGDVFVKYTTPSEIITNVDNNSDWLYGLSLLAPTSFVDGEQNTITVRITAYASS